jgi:hypothetical protein
MIRLIISKIIDIYNYIYEIITNRNENETKNEIKKLKNELLLSDKRNKSLLNIIDILRCELINKDNSFSINEELKQLKIEHLTLTKLYENAKIESSNAIIILKHANERNYILQERYKLLKMELQELKSISNNICTICCENIINISCVPCGHTYCEKCIRIPENNNCYICRQNFYRIIKIYL